MQGKYYLIVDDFPTKTSNYQQYQYRFTLQMICLICILNLDILHDMDQPTTDEKLIMQILFLRYNEAIAALVKFKLILCTLRQ